MNPFTWSSLMWSTLIFFITLVVFAAWPNIRLRWKRYKEARASDRSVELAPPLSVPVLIPVRDMAVVNNQAEVVRLRRQRDPHNRLHTRQIKLPPLPDTLSSETGAVTSVAALYLQSVCADTSTGVTEKSEGTSAVIPDCDSGDSEERGGDTPDYSSSSSNSDTGSE